MEKKQQPSRHDPEKNLSPESGSGAKGEVDASSGSPKQAPEDWEWDLFERDEAAWTRKRHPDWSDEEIGWSMLHTAMIRYVDHVEQLLAKLTPEERERYHKIEAEVKRDRNKQKKNL